MLKRYVYDPTGRSPDNLVKKERHTINTQDTGYSNGLFFPRYGAFFGDSLIVQQGEKTLIKNEDWQYAFFWQNTTEKVGQPVFLAIQLINPNLIGDIQLTYQVVGGEYTGRFEGIENMITHLPKQNRNVFWDDVQDKPAAYIPERHWHQIQDVFGLTPLALAIHDLRDAVTHGSVLKLKTVYDRFLKLKQYVEGLLSTFDEKSKRLSQELETLDAKLNTLVTRDELDAVVSEKVAEHITNVENTINELRGDMQTVRAEVSAKMTEVDEKIAAQKAETDKVPGLLERNKQEITAQQQALENRLNNTLADQSANVERKLEQNLAIVNATKTELTNNLNKAVAAQETKLNEAKKELQNEFRNQHNSAVQDLNQRIEKNKTDIANLTTTVSANDLRHDQALQAVNQNITHLTTQVNENNNNTQEAINTLRDNTNNELTGVKNAANALATTVANNNDNATTKITELNNRVNGLRESSSQALNDYITKTNEKLNNYNERITENAYLIADHTTALTGVNEQIQAVNTNTTTIKENLENNYKPWAAIQDHIEDKVSDTNARVSEVANTVTQQGNNISDLSASIDRVDAKVRNNEDNLNNLQNAVSELTQDNGGKLDTLKQDLLEITTRVNGHDTALGEINDRFIPIEAKLTEHTEKLNTLENSNTTTNARIDSLSGELQTHIVGITENVASLTTNVGALTARNNEQDQLISEIQTQLTTATSDLATLTTTVTEHNQATDTQLGQVFLQIGTLKNNVTDNTSRITALETAKTESKTKVDDLKNKLNATNKALTDLTNEVSTANGGNTQLATKVEELTNTVNANKQAADAANAEQNASIEALQTTVTRQGQNVNQLATNLNNLANKVTPLETTVNNLEPRVTALETKAAGLATDISRNKTAADTELAKINENVSLLKTTVTTHAQQISAVTTKEADLRQKVTDLTTSQAAQDTRLDGVDDNYNQLSSNLNNHVSSTRENITAINQALTVANSHRDAINNTVQGLNRNLNTMNQTQSNHTDRITALENSQKTQDANLTSNKQRIADLEDAVNSFRTASGQSAEGVAARVTQLENNVNRMDGVLNTQVNQITVQANRLNIIDKANKDRDKKITALRNDVTGLQDTVNGLPARLASVRTEALAETAKVNTKVEQVKTSVDEVNEKAQQALTKANGNTANITTNTDEINKLKTKLADYNSQANTQLTNSVDQVKTDVENLKPKVEKNISDIRSLNTKFQSVYREHRKFGVADLTGNEYDRNKYYPVTIDNIYPHRTIKLVVQYYYTRFMPEYTPPSWYPKNGDMHLEWDTIDSFESYNDSGFIIHSFNYTPLNVNQPPAIKLQHKGSEDIVYLRGGMQYQFDFWDMDDVWAVDDPIILYRPNEQTRDPIEYSEEHIIEPTINNLDRRIRDESAQRQTALTALEQRVIEAANNNQVELDPLTLKQLIRQELEKMVAQQHDADNASDDRVVIPPMDIQPSDASEFNTFTGMAISNIIHMDGNTDENAEVRTVFAPSRCFEFEKSGDFSIPEVYDEVLAQVVLVTAYRPARGMNNQQFKVAMTPSVKIGYVVLKGNSVVPITVGQISSFGPYLTNDGIDRKGLVQPSHPIYSPIMSVTDSSEANVANLIGKHGKVLIFV